MNDMQIRFGFPDQWRAFAERNPVFLERFDRLRALLDTTFNRKWSSAEPIERFIFTAGRLTVDDWLEVLLLCGNGEAYGAQKVLRPMFERVVTLKYLHAHPEELDAYLDYYWINQRKLVSAIESTFKKGLLDPAKVQEVEDNYQRLKDRYQVTLCRECGTTHLNIAWNPKDIITMAKEVGLTDFIVPAYYLPMQHTHPSVKGMLDRLEITADGVTLAERLQPLTGDRILCAAHGLLLHSLDVQFEHFKLDAEPYKQLVTDFGEIWKRPDLQPGCGGAESASSAAPCDE